MSKLYSPEYLAYCAEQGLEPYSQVVQLFFSQGCRAAPDSFSPPAQKTVSELGGSGAGLVGNPSQILDYCDTIPVTMSGDAWESAARHVLAMRQKALEPCLFPQPEFKPVFGLAMTGYRQWPVGIRDDFVMVGTFCGSLDAPFDLPQGSHDSMRFGNQINAFATVRREMYL